MYRIVMIAIVLIALLSAAPVSKAKGPPEGKGMVPELKKSSDADEMVEMANANLLRVLGN